LCDNPERYIDESVNGKTMVSPLLNLQMDKKQAKNRKGKVKIKES